VAAPLALAARVGMATLADDLERWALRLAAGVLVALLLVATLVCLLFGSVLVVLNGPASLLGGGRGLLRTGPASAAALAEIPADQLAFMQRVATSSRCGLPWQVLAAIASIESGFGRTADAFSPAGAYGYGQFLEGTWSTYGGGVPRRTSDPAERARPVDQRYDSTNYHYALPAMARNLCASGAGQNLRQAIFAYNHADWYVAEVLDLAARYGALGAAAGLVPGWATLPALNQYDPGNYRSQTSWLQWQKAACSAAALAWLLRAYGQPGITIDDAIALIGPNTGISTSLGLLDARGPALARALAGHGLRPRTPGQRPLGSVADLKAWLDQGLLLMDGGRWFGAGHWFVGIGYDQNGVHIRDSSGWDTRYLTWSRLYGEVGFSGWVVRIARGKAPQGWLAPGDGHGRPAATDQAL
jgi:Transglycosylase SLT domain